MPLSAYELAREAKIQQNKAMISSLGLDQFSAPPKPSAKRARPKSGPKNKSPTVPSRRSLRASMLVDRYGMVPDDEVQWDACEEEGGARGKSGSMAETPALGMFKLTYGGAVVEDAPVPVREDSPRPRSDSMLYPVSGQHGLAGGSGGSSRGSSRGGSLGGLAGSSGGGFRGGFRGGLAGSSGGGFRGGFRGGLAGRSGGGFGGGFGGSFPGGSGGSSRGGFRGGFRGGLAGSSGGGSGRSSRGGSLGGFRGGLAGSSHGGSGRSSHGGSPASRAPPLQKASALNFSSTHILAEMFSEVRIDIARASEQPQQQPVRAPVQSGRAMDHVVDSLAIVLSRTSLDECEPSEIDNLADSLGQLSMDEKLIPGTQAHRDAVYISITEYIAKRLAEQQAEQLAEQQAEQLAAPARPASKLCQVKPWSVENEYEGRCATCLFITKVQF
jgi:hypothetical protein